jgi:HD superfamily phosphodiesterase
MDDHVLMAALAGLLHDVGKFTGRAAVGTSVDFTRDEQKAVGY